MPKEGEIPRFARNDSAWDFFDNQFIRAQLFMVCAAV
jgi:hypothetical protein